MGKEHELSMLVDELKKCGETLVGISGNWLAFSVMQVQKSRLQKKLLLRKKQLGNLKPEYRKKRNSHLKMSGLFVRIRPVKAILHRSRPLLISMVWEDCPM